jgi:hypothetical protein
LPPTAVLKNSIKTKLPLILLVLGLAGCQPKSEIDKCVEAQITSICNSGDSECIKRLTKSLGGQFRLDCLKAQAGR